MRLLHRFSLHGCLLHGCLLQYVFERDATAMAAVLDQTVAGGVVGASHQGFHLVNI